MKLILLPKKMILIVFVEVKTRTEEFLDASCVLQLPEKNRSQSFMQQMAIFKDSILIKRAGLMLLQLL